MEGERLAPLVRLLLSTGLRRGDVLALTWDDVDLDAAAVRVGGTLGRTSTGLTVERTMTEESRRTIPLPRAALEALRRQQVLQETDRARLLRAWDDSGFVFTNELGAPHSSYAITADIYSHVAPQQACEAADRLDDNLYC